MEVVEICQEFRKLAKFYLLQDTDDDNKSDDQLYGLNDSFDYEKKSKNSEALERLRVE